MGISKEKLQEVISYYVHNGEKDTCQAFGITEETLGRYRRKAREKGVGCDDMNKTMRDIIEMYSEDELRAIARGGRIMPGATKVPVVEFSGKHIKVGHITDTHIGSSFFNKSRLFQAFEEFRKEGVDFITHSGDVTEGMSGRPGHIYELDQLGYAQQSRRP